jgi:hypothetical protein
MAHHDTGYRELFSHPEFVQQLLEGFASPEIAALMDFSTLTNHSGHYITPLFEEKIEDVVWSVEVHWQGHTQRVFVYLLLEFQSKVDTRMPIRLLHYVACFYDHLLKTKVTTISRGLPPILPIVLYNGSRRWKAATDVYELIRPEPPAIWSAYQPHLRYYVIDEGAYDPEQLAAIGSPLSSVFEVETVSADRAALQAAVERLTAILRADPNRERLDRVITRWLKRHLLRLGAGVDLYRLNSLVEDQTMLAENLENWAKRERAEGEQIGLQRGEQIGLQRARLETAHNLLKLGVVDDAQIAEVTGLDLDQVRALREADQH